MRRANEKAINSNMHSQHPGILPDPVVSGRDDADDLAGIELVG